MNHNDQMQSAQSRDPNVQSTPIAVVGMACCYPGARDIGQLWENILARRRQFRRFPSVRLSLEDYFEPDPKTADRTYCPWAAVIDGFVFDWARRRIPQSTYAATDIVLALEVPDTQQRHRTRAL